MSPISPSDMVPMDENQNAFLLIGRTQSALKAVEDRQNRHEERFDAYLTDDAHAKAALTEKLGTVIDKLNQAEGRSLQRADDTAKLRSRITLLIMAFSLFIAMLGVMIEGHVHFYGN